MIRSLFFSVCATALVAVCAADVWAQAAPPARCLAFEIYVVPGDVKPPLQEAAEQFAKQSGIALRVMNPTEDAAKARLESLAKHFKREPQPPLVYGCGKLVGPGDDVAKLVAEMKAVATMNLFVRTGCPHCAEAKKWLPKFEKQFPGVTVVQKDIVTDSAAANELQEVFKKYKVSGGSVPCFDACGEAIVGFSEANGERVLAAWKKWSHECKRGEGAKGETGAKGAEGKSSAVSRTSVVFCSLLQEESAPPPLPLPDEPPPLPLPEDGDKAASENSPPLPIGAGDEKPSDAMTVPWLGSIQASKLGMPVFTIAVGLIDGFNPCAMWVLLFLLSLLVNLQDRAKILAVAGTFVLISGAAYFAFMAAWLNVFMYIGLLKPVQIGLALIAITIGLIHIKDFFAFKKGVSLSIPEAAKPKIYEQSRKIVMAESLLPAIAGATILAVMVNFIELLCTAGLPAMYTAILARQDLPPWAHYGYLLLYNLAYMFDDALMVTVVVVTLSKHKLQETEGRWLKLVGGAVILALGVVMLVRPQLLV